MTDYLNDYNPGKSNVKVELDLKIMLLKKKQKILPMLILVILH